MLFFCLASKLVSVKCGVPRIITPSFSFTNLLERTESKYLNLSLLLSDAHYCVFFDLSLKDMPRINP